MTHPAPDPHLALDYLLGRAPLGPLLDEARRLRDESKGSVVTYSRKVFIPLTTLCRDVCAYCTFAKPPGAGGMYMEPAEVLAVARAGERAGCTEALLTLGDRPEDRWPQARQFLEDHGYATTMDYVRAMARLIKEETELFPHANPGLMSEADIESLRPWSVSMGLMLENSSPRLLEPGMPHHDCPDKDPALRLETIAAAGRARVPFTTGVLIGIGESPTEIVESLFALADAAEGGHVQEVIVQNFRAKADTPMRRNSEPRPEWIYRIVALARWILGPEMNIQVPPNLTRRYEVFLEAGINDWGGVSPLTIDWVNPEQPWPHLTDLEERTRAAGHVLRPRLPIYPEYVDAHWIDDGLMAKVREAVDLEGYALSPQRDAALR